MSNFAKDQCRALGVKLTGTGDTTLFTATATGYTQIIGVRCTNITGTAATITVTWVDNDAGPATYYLVYQQSVPGNQFLYMPLEGFGIMPSDLIKAQAGTANAIDVVLTIVEVPGRSG